MILLPFFTLFYRGSSKTAALALTLSITLLFPAHPAFAKNIGKTIENNCESILINADIENRYKKIKKNMEQSFSQGLPKKIKENLIQISQKIDKLSLQTFDMNPENHQEINLLTQQTIDQLEKMIGLLPKASKLAPKMRKQYVMPFTNLNSIKAEHQNCLMEIAVKESQSQNIKVENSGNIYKQLTSELNQLNQELYKLETTDIERFIGYRSQLLSSLERYNTNDTSSASPSEKIPEILNSVQTEIEKIIPSLQLSKTYYSILN